MPHVVPNVVANMISNVVSDRYREDAAWKNKAAHTHKTRMQMAGDRWKGFTAVRWLFGGSMFSWWFCFCYSFCRSWRCRAFVVTKEPLLLSLCNTRKWPAIRCHTAPTRTSPLLNNGIATQPRPCEENSPCPIPMQHHLCRCHPWCTPGHGING